MRKFKPLPRLSRGWKTARNVLLAVLMLLFLWSNAGFPLPYSPQGSFQRAVARNWAGPARIQGVFQCDYAFDGRSWVVGVAGEKILVQQQRDGYLKDWPRDQTGPSLALSPANVRVSAFWALAVDVPAEAASASLTLTLDGWIWPEETAAGERYASRQDGFGPDRAADSQYWSVQYQLPGERLEEGGVLFIMPVADPENREKLPEAVRQSAITWMQVMESTPDRRFFNCSVQAVFYDGAGTELARVEMESP